MPTKRKMAKVFTKAAMWRAIRKQCLQCVGGSAALVATCPSEDCYLWPYRFGTPKPPPGEAQNIP